MRETFNELDLSSEFIEIYMSEEEPNFRLSTHGYTGTTQVGITAVKIVIHTHTYIDFVIISSV